MSISYGNNIPLSPPLSSPLCSLFFGVHLWFMPARFDFVPFDCSCRFECRKPATLHPVFLFRIWCDYSNAWNILNERPVMLDSWEYWEFVLWLHLDYGSELTLLSCLFCFRMNLISWRTQKLHAAKLPCLCSRCVCWLPKLWVLTSGSQGSVAPLTRFRKQQLNSLCVRGNLGNSVDPKQKLDFTTWFHTNIRW